MRHFDVIIVGMGGMGTAAAFHLAIRGSRVLGLDRFSLSHDRGSSHGHTRLIRTAYFEHPDYVPLLKRASHLWSDLQERRGLRLLATTGLLMAGPSDGMVVSGSLRSAREHGLAVEALGAAEAMARWPAFRIDERWTAIHEPTAGALFVEDCVRAHAEEAVAAGAVMRFGVTVNGYRAEGEGMVVDTDDGSFAASRLVLCPGPWASNVISVPACRFSVLRKSLFWYRPQATVAAFGEGALPCFGFDTSEGFFYGMPAFDERGVKIANHSGGTLLADPFAVDRRIDPGERSEIERWIDSSMPSLGHAASDHATCLYTMSPDGHFVLGLHPEQPRVAVAAGFSGHGFKFASVVGEALADLALEGATPLPVGFLAPQRFTHGVGAG